ncbi:WD40-repeat-containing domain protein [Phlebopus sp. FC_14]|nr:WD40-repeat-containing domain protein [Phlebopus sp. FC_14]
MAILPDAAQNVVDLLRRRENRIRGRINGHNPYNPVLSHTLLHTLAGVYSPVSFLPDSQHFVGGCSDGTVRTWRVTDGREVGVVMKHGSPVRAVAVSGDGKTIASGGGDGKVVFWNTDTCKKLVRSQGKHSNWVVSLSFAPDSQRVASGSYDGWIIIWSTLTGERVTGPLRGHKGWVPSLAFSPAGDKIASCDSWGKVRIWDSSSGERVPLLIPARALSVRWSPGGSQLICATFDGTVAFVDFSNGALLATCRGHEDAIYSIVVSRCGTWLASASSDRTVRLWDTSTHQQLASLDHPDQVESVSISPNGRHIASVGHGSKAYIWRRLNVDPTFQEDEDPAVSHRLSVCTCERG